MSKGGIRIALMMGSTIVGLVLAKTIWDLRPEADSVELIDTRAEFEDLLASRSVQAASPLGPTATELSSNSSLATVPGTTISMESELVRGPVPMKIAGILFPSVRKNPETNPPDPQAYYWEKPNSLFRRGFREHPDRGWKVRTNSDGFRKKVDVRDEQPDLRILVTGDSHTAGVVPEEENFVQVLEASLAKIAPEKSVEALNAGKGGYSFYNYLGVLEKHLALKPDIFVVAAFGGNDFGGCIKPFQYFNRLPKPKRDRPIRAGATTGVVKLRQALYSQDFKQIADLSASKVEEHSARMAAKLVLAEIKQICRNEGIRLIYVYIPPCTDSQPHILGDDIEKARKIFGLTKEDIRITNRIADDVMDFVAEQQIEAIDMRPIYETSESDCYWSSDLHINTEGHRLVAKALTERLKKVVSD